MKSSSLLEIQVVLPLACSHLGTNLKLFHRRLQKVDAVIERKKGKTGTEVQVRVYASVCECVWVFVGASQCEKECVSQFGKPKRDLSYREGEWR